MNSQLRCRCGAIQGRVDPGRMYARAVCYCKDCQAFARFLGSPDEILNELGGSEIVAIFPGAVQFTAGLDKLACMSLSEKGILRWYAGCCRTPIGNTPRDWKIAYLGLSGTCLSDLDDSFGPLKIALNTDSATGELKGTPLASFLGLMRIVRNIIGARLRGTYRQNQLFSPESGAPIRTPTVLTRAERMALI